jgi:hypothetical protein
MWKENENATDFPESAKDRREFASHSLLYVDEREDQTVSARSIVR